MVPPVEVIQDFGEMCSKSYNFSVQETVFGQWIHDNDRAVRVEMGMKSNG